MAYILRVFTSGPQSVISSMLVFIFLIIFANINVWIRISRFSADSGPQEVTKADGTPLRSGYCLYSFCIL